MKKIIAFILILFIAFPVFSQTVEELKTALAKTTELVEKLIDENDAKDKIIASKEILLQEAVALMEKKDKTIADLNVAISTLTSDNDKVINDLKKIIDDYKKDISELRKIIDDFIKKYDTLSKTNFIMIEAGYTTASNFTIDLDYSFSLWRLRFLTGIQYITPIEFGVKLGVGVSL